MLGFNQCSTKADVPIVSQDEKQLLPILVRFPICPTQSITGAQSLIGDVGCFNPLISLALRISSWPTTAVCNCFLTALSIDTIARIILRTGRSDSQSLFLSGGSTHIEH